MKTVRSVLLISLCLAGPAVAAQHEMPPGMTHEQHFAQLNRLAAVKARGATAMGFDQESTTHHFLLTSHGGTIQIDVKDPADSGNVRRIRAHLSEIATEFKLGDFQKPFATHHEVPPGVERMQQLKAEIAYVFTLTSNGGVVRISTSNAAAIAAIHEFLRYQITEHATGDPATVEN